MRRGGTAGKKLLSMLSRVSYIDAYLLDNSRNIRHKRFVFEISKVCFLVLFGKKKEETSNGAPTGWS